MAAFINALAEEGTLPDIIYFIFEQRKENHLTEVPSNFYDHWDRCDLIGHLAYLWSTRPKSTLHPDKFYGRDRDYFARCIYERRIDVV